MLSWRNASKLLSGFRVLRAQIEEAFFSGGFAGLGFMASLQRPVVPGSAEVGKPNAESRQLEAALKLPAGCNRADCWVSKKPKGKQ